MNIAKISPWIFCSIIIIILHTSFAFPTTVSPPTTKNKNDKDEESTTLEVTTSPPSSALTPSPSPSEEPSTEIITSQPQGRNMRFPNPYENVVVLAPIQDNLDLPDYRKQFVSLDQPVPPYTLGYDDTVDVMPTQYEPIVSDLRNAVVYPVERLRDEELATAESNIVFRPLFTYRRQTEQRRRIYSPSPSSSSSSSSHGNGQRRRQGYTYPVYYSSYPSYYVNAQYDYVP